MRPLPCTLLLELGQHFVYFEGSKSKCAFVKIATNFLIVIKKWLFFKIVIKKCESINTTMLKDQEMQAVRVFYTELHI